LLLLATLTTVYDNWHGLVDAFNLRRLLNGAWYNVLKTKVLCGVMLATIHKKYLVTLRIISIASFGSFSALRKYFFYRLATIQKMLECVWCAIESELRTRDIFQKDCLLTGSLNLKLKLSLRKIKLNYE